MSIITNGFKTLNYQELKIESWHQIEEWKQISDECNGRSLPVFPVGKISQKALKTLMGIVNRLIYLAAQKYGVAVKNNGRYEIQHRKLRAVLAASDRKYITVNLCQTSLEGTDGYLATQWQGSFNNRRTLKKYREQLCLWGVAKSPECFVTQRVVEGVKQYRKSVVQYVQLNLLKLIALFEALWNEFVNQFGIDQLPGHQGEFVFQLAKALRCAVKRAFQRRKAFDQETPLPEKMEKCRDSLDWQWILKWHNQEEITEFLEQASSCLQEKISEIAEAEIRSRACNWMTNLETFGD